MEFEENNPFSEEITSALSTYQEDFVRNNLMSDAFLDFVEENTKIRKSKSFNLETEIASAFWHLQIKPVSSNHLYVYIDTYKNNYDADIVHPSHDRVVGYNDPAADYSLYMNLENRDDTRHVPIKDRKKFEADNKILRMFNNNYIQTQILFGKYVLRYGQVKAIDMLYDELKFNN